MKFPDQKPIRSIVLGRLANGPARSRDLFRGLDDAGFSSFSSPTMWNALIKALNNLRSEGLVVLIGRAKGARWSLAEQAEETRREYEFLARQAHAANTTSEVSQ